MLLSTLAFAGKKSLDDYPYVFSVTGTAMGNAAIHQYCPITVTAAGITYDVYADYWNCPQLNIGQQINGKFTTRNTSVMVRANAIDFAYLDAKGKLHHYVFVIASQRQ
jgi:hypothetical protein